MPRAHLSELQNGRHTRTSQAIQFLRSLYRLDVHSVDPTHAVAKLRLEERMLLPSGMARQSRRRLEEARDFSLARRPPRSHLLEEVTVNEGDLRERR